MSVIPLLRMRGEAVLRVEPEIAVPTVHLRARDAGPRRTLFTATAPDEL